MRADGKGERPVFPEEPAFRKNPVWSPDGKKFAYAQIDFDAKRTTIYTAKTDGTLINRIVEIENTGSTRLVSRWNRNRICRIR